MQALLGCDGPFSGVRAQCVQDSEPAYDVSRGAMGSGCFCDCNVNGTVGEVK